jgi:hypothetical protein
MPCSYVLFVSCAVTIHHTLPTYQRQSWPLHRAFGRNDNKLESVSKRDITVGSETCAMHFPSGARPQFL